MEECEGYVDRITFRNEENGYTVLTLINPNEGNAEECCVGWFSSVSEGEYLQVKGTRVIHKSYGPQIQVESYQSKKPEDIVSIERYLGSGAIKGVGLALAARITKKFKEETFTVIEREPERLTEVKGISERLAESIAQQFREKEQMREATIFLQEYGISVNMAVRIYQYYRDGIYEVLQKNPYRLAEDINGIGFKLADTIAQRAGLEFDSAYRIRAGVLYALKQSANQGHCYLPEQELGSRTAQMLALPEQMITEQIENLIAEKEILAEVLPDGNKHLYSGTLYYMELNCARMLLDLNLSFFVEEERIQKRVIHAEKKQKISLDPLQQTAVCQALQNGVTIITGGPGTGKTTTINTILQVLNEDGADVLLAAPTGRAAKRMSETTGFEAQTIHRMLELTGGSGTDTDGNAIAAMHFERDEKHPLEADVVIVDEFSMVDIYLLYALLRALVPGSRLIMVGDVNQLPSVGPGNVLHDMIQAKFCPVVCLTHIFRQAAESSIVVNAHKIKAGEKILLDNKNKDFFHLERQNVQDVINVTIQLVMKNMPSYVDASPYDIQVLTPMRKGELGVEHLNIILQNYINPPSPQKTEREFHGTLFREGDKVMQIRNDYQKKWLIKDKTGDILEEGTGVFNGDIGVIRRMVKAEELVEVEFDDRVVAYDFGQLDELELAYAITIHKSQGSEYPAVVIPILTGPRLLLNRNLLYTAVTRAKSCVTLVGSRDTIYRMIENVYEQTRYSGLCGRLEEMKREEYF